MATVMVKKRQWMKTTEWKTEPQFFVELYCIVRNYLRRRNFCTRKTNIYFLLDISVSIIMTYQDIAIVHSMIFNALVFALSRLL